MNSTETTHASTPVAQRHREEILAVTSRCLHQEGYDATTIRKIAALLDCAVGSIYRYFSDKHEILSLVTQRTLDPVVHCLDAGSSLEESIRLYHQIVSQSPEIYRLMFWLACQGVGARGDDASLQARSPVPLPRVVERIIEGWTRHSDAATAQHVWAIVHGCILLGRDAEACIELALPLAPSVPIAAAPAHSLPEFAPVSAEGPENVRAEMPEIVITMTQPPAPRPSSAAQPTPPLEATPAPAGDDVCLL